MTDKPSLQFGVLSEEYDNLLRLTDTNQCDLANDCSICRGSVKETAQSERRLHYQLRKRLILEMLTYRHKLRSPNSERRGDPEIYADPTIPILDVTKYIGRRWSLSILALEKHGHHFPFIHVALFLLAPYVGHPLETTHATLFKCVIKLNASYLDVQYHNSTHAAIVAHLFIVLRRIFKNQAPMSRLDEAVCIIASLGHDAGHFGRSNMFCTETNDPLSTLFNDTSILENYHAFITWSILMEADSNIFQSVDRSEFSMIKKHIAELIIATDMSLHFTIISHFCELKPSETTLVGEKFEWRLARLMLKLADIGHAALNWEDHYTLSVRIVREFYEQGDEERHLNIPVTPLCDRSRHVMFYSDQLGFLQFVVLPLVLALKSSVQTEEAKKMNSIINRVQRNKARWTQIGKSRVALIERELSKQQEDKLKAQNEGDDCLQGMDKVSDS